MAKKTIRDSVQSTYIGVQKLNEPDKIFDSIPLEYKPRNYDEVSDGVFNIFRNKHDEKKFIKNLQKKYTIDMSKFSAEDRTKFFKDVFKFGVFQKITDTEGLIKEIPTDTVLQRLINDNRSELIFSNSIVTDLNSLNDAQKTSVINRLLKPISGLIPDDLWNQGKMAALPKIARQIPIAEMAPYIAPLLKSIADSPFISTGKTKLSALSAQQENFKLKHAVQDNSNAGIRYTQYKHSSSPTVYGDALASEKVAAIKSIAPMLQQVRLDLANEVMSPTQQSGMQLLKKTISNVAEPITFTARKALDHGAIRDPYQLKLAKDNMLKNGVVGYDYETIGDQIHEYAYLTAEVKHHTVPNDKFSPDITNETVGLIGLHSETERDRVESIIQNLRRSGTIDDDSKYILQRLWAIGKAEQSGYIKQDNTGRFYLEDFYDVSKANMQEVNAIELGYQKLVEIAEVQKQQPKVSVDYNGKSYNLVQYEKDLLMPLIEAKDQNKTIMAYNGLNFDTKKFVKMFAQGEYISDDARKLFYDSGISGIRGYENYFDPLTVVRSGIPGQEINDKFTRQLIMEAGQTFNTNTATYIRSGAFGGNTGVIHTGRADTFKMLVSAVHSSFDPRTDENGKKTKSTFFDEIVFGNAKNKVDTVSVGSVLSFNNSSVPLGADVGGLMFTVDPISGEYRIAGNGTTVSYSAKGKPSLNDKSFGSFFVKDAPYVISDIQQYSPKDIEAFGRAAVSLDSSILSDELYGIKLSRLSVDGEGMAKTQPLYLVASKTGVEALLASNATYRGNISFDTSGKKPVIKMEQELGKYIEKIAPKLRQESEKKARENIATRPLEMWNSLNRKGRAGQSIADILKAAPDIQSGKAEIIDKLTKNQGYFGFHINSINQIENIIGTFETLNAYNNAGLFDAFGTIFNSKFSQGTIKDKNGKAVNVYDKGTMFAQFVENLKKGVSDLVQSSAVSPSISTPYTKEYKDSHFQFDLTPVVSKTKVHTDFEGSYSDATVTFDIGSDNTLNHENRKQISKLTRIFGQRDDKAGRTRALRMYGQKLSNYYGLDYDVSDKADFEEGLLDDLVRRMRSIRAQTKNGNIPIKITEDVTDTAFAELFSILDLSTQQKLLQQAAASTGDVKRLPKDEKNNIIKADILKRRDRTAVKNFGNTDISDHDKLLDFIAKEIGEDTGSEKVARVAQETEENYSNIKGLTDMILDEIVSGSQYDLVDKPGEGLFLSTGVGSSELNISKMLPTLKWNQDLGRSQVYIGRVPIANMNAAYIDNKGSVQYGREIEAVADKMGLLPRIKYVGTMDPAARLNYVASVFQEFAQNMREFSVIRKDNEDLQKTASFDFRDLYDRILNRFTENWAAPGEGDKENPKRFRQFAVEEFIAAVDNVSGLSNPEKLKAWAQSFADIKAYTNDKRRNVPSTIASQQVFLRENMYDIFKVITSDKNLYGIFFNDKDVDGYAIDAILDSLDRMNIATRHANKAIGYLDEESLAFEGIGVPNKRHVNYAEKRNKDLNAEKHNQYIEAVTSIIGDDNAEILQKSAGYQSIFRGARESLGQDKKTYTGLILETTHRNFKEILSSADFEGYARKTLNNLGYAVDGKVIKKVLNDVNIYLGESSSIGSPHYLALNQPQSVQRIHASDVVPTDELRLTADHYIDSEFKRRKELDFTLRLRDNNERILFTYGNSVHVDKGQSIITTKRYPDSSQVERAENYGRVSMRYYKTVQGRQVEASEQEINDILNTEENLARIASAMDPIGRASQRQLTEEVDRILSEHGAVRDYVLHSDFDNTARKLMFNSQEKSMNTGMVTSLGRYDERIAGFFNELKLGGIYLDRKVSMDFIESIVKRTEHLDGTVAVWFNEDGSLYQSIKRNSDFKKAYIAERKKIQEQQKDIKQQLKEAQDELEKVTGKRRLATSSLEDLLAGIQHEIDTITNKITSVSKEIARKEKAYSTLKNNAQKDFDSKVRAALKNGEITDVQIEEYGEQHREDVAKANSIYREIEELKNLSAAGHPELLKQIDEAKQKYADIEKLYPVVKSLEEQLDSLNDKSHVKYEDVVARELKRVLKKHFGENATAETLRDAILIERDANWKVLSGFFGGLYGLKNAESTIAAFASNTQEIVKSSHAEARGILTSIAEGAVTHFMHNEGMDRENAIVATRKFFNEKILEDNSPQIDVNTGIVPEGIQISTDKMNQHKKEIIGFLNGMELDATGNTILEKIFTRSNEKDTGTPDGPEGRIRLVSAEIQAMSDPEGAIGHSVDKNKGFMYSTRVHTSLDYRRYSPEDLENVFEYYKGKKGGIDKFNKLFKGLAETYLDKDGEQKMRIVTDSLTQTKMFSGTIAALNKAVDLKGGIEYADDGRLIIPEVPSAVKMPVEEAVNKYGISPERGIEIYAQQSVAQAHSFNKKMQGFYDLEENKALSGTHTQMQLLGNKQKEFVEKYAQDKDMEIVHIGDVNTSTTAASDDPHSIYQNDNFIIDMGEDSRMWLTDKNGNKQRYIMSAYTANEMLDKDTSQVVSTKMQDAIKGMQSVYNSYITNGKDVQRPEVASAKMEAAMQELSGEYYENMRMLASGKNSIANTSTKVRLERSFNAKGLVTDKLATSNVVEKFGKEIADTSLYVGKDKAIELLGGESHIRGLAKKLDISFDEALGQMLGDMSSNGLLAIVKREPTNYAQSVSTARVFYDANMAENQVGAGRVISDFMKLDSDGDLASVAALTGDFTATVKKTVTEDGKQIEVNKDYELTGSNIERNLISSKAKAVNVSDEANTLFTEAERNADYIAHSNTAQMVTAKLNKGYTDNATINAGERIFKEWLGDGIKAGTLSKYAINGALVNYDDVRAYSKLSDTDRQAVDKTYQNYLASDEYKKAATAVVGDFDPNARLTSAEQIATANQYIKQVGTDNVSDELMNAIRVNAAKDVVYDKALSDSMQGAAGIINTATNKSRNIISELMNKGETNLTPSQANVLMNILAEIDESGQAPKNHSVLEPADIAKNIEEYVWRRGNAYSGWAEPIGTDGSGNKIWEHHDAVSTSQAGDNVVSFLTENFGNISEMKNMKQVIPSNIPEKDREEYAQGLIRDAVNALLPDGRKISDDYWRETSSAYIQNSGDVPVVFDTTNTADPLKRGTEIALDMSTGMGRAQDTYKAPSTMTEKIQVKQYHDSKSVEPEKPRMDVVQEKIEQNFVEPDYESNAGSNTRAIIENIADEEEDKLTMGNAVRRGAATIVSGIGKSLSSSKGILALAGSIMAAGIIGGAPTAPSGSEAQQTVQDAPSYQIEGSLVGDISPQIHQRAPQGYVVNVNASSDKGQDYISGLMQQTMRAQFPNQNISMSMNINDSSSNISFRDIANYMQGMI